MFPLVKSAIQICKRNPYFRVCHKATEIFEDVNRLIAAMKMIFLKSPNRRSMYKDVCGDLPLPPEPVLMR